MGCQRYIEKPVLILPPDSLVENCKIDEPYSSVEFRLKVLEYNARGTDGQWEAAFLVQTEQWFSQTNNLTVCNVQLKHLREWLSKQKDIHKKKTL